jgi:aspartate racemase
MKTLGLIGGISWHSTAAYYRLINQLTQERLGGNHSAELLLYSVNYHEFKELQANNNWNEIGNMLSGIAMRLQDAGAEGLVICSNTPHLVADRIVKDIQIPLLHIAEATANEIVGNNITRVGLLGTKFTMEQSFFKERLSAAGIETLVPEEEERRMIHQSIINELSKGILNPATKKSYLSIIDGLCQRGAEAIVLGCTEFSLLLDPSAGPVKLFDTTAIHSKRAANFVLGTN